MGEAKRREPDWQTQIVLCYETEPYIAFDVTPAMLEQAVAVEDLTGDSQAWLIASLNHLREEVALIRDYGEEVVCDLNRRSLMAFKAILVVQYLLLAKQMNLSNPNIGSVLLNLQAGQAKKDKKVPAFQIAGLPKPLSVEEIRAMSTARYVFKD